MEFPIKINNAITTTIIIVINFVLLLLSVTYQSSAVDEYVGLDHARIRDDAVNKILIGQHASNVALLVKYGSCHTHTAQYAYILTLGWYLHQITPTLISYTLE